MSNAFPQQINTLGWIELGTFCCAMRVEPGFDRFIDRRAQLVIRMSYLNHAPVEVIKVFKEAAGSEEQLRL